MLVNDSLELVVDEDFARHNKSFFRIFSSFSFEKKTLEVAINPLVKNKKVPSTLKEVEIE